MHTSQLGASRKTSVLVIIVTRKATKEGLCKDYLTTMKAKKLIKAFNLGVFMIQ